MRSDHTERAPVNPSGFSRGAEPIGAHGAPTIWWSLVEVGVQPGGVKPFEALDNSRTEHRQGYSGGGEVDVSCPPDIGTDAAHGNGGPQVIRLEITEEESPDRPPTSQLGP